MGGCVYPDNKGSGHDPKCSFPRLPSLPSASVGMTIGAVFGIILCLGCCAGIGVGIYFCVKNNKKRSQYASTEGVKATTSNTGAYAPLAGDPTQNSVDQYINSLESPTAVATSNTGAYAPPTAYPTQNTVGQPLVVASATPVPVAVQAPVVAPAAAGVAVTTTIQ